MRTIITRFGVVLSPNGGAMQQMLRPLQITRIATAIGPGSQPFPWIGINDLCRSMEFFIQNKETKGVYNLVVPQQVTQYAFTKVMGEAYHAFATLTIPQILFRMLYGESASFLTTGQAVRPTRLLEDGFQFTVPTVEQLFEEIYLSLRPISEH
jgi:NAD dependent epimerase/dehydratase family enzyme